MRSTEYEMPPKASKKLAKEINNKIGPSVEGHKGVHTAPVLDRPATTRLKSKDIFIEQQRLKK